MQLHASTLPKASPWHGDARLCVLQRPGRQAFILVLGGSQVVGQHREPLTLACRHGGMGIEVGGHRERCRHAYWDAPHVADCWMLHVCKFNKPQGALITDRTAHPG